MNLLKVLLEKNKYQSPQMEKSLMEELMEVKNQVKEMVKMKEMVMVKEMVKMKEMLRVKKVVIGMVANGKKKIQTTEKLKRRKKLQ
jgi:hypothetical protein